MPAGHRRRTESHDSVGFRMIDGESHLNPVQNGLFSEDGDAEKEAQKGREKEKGFKGEEKGTCKGKRKAEGELPPFFW